jgi:hypothetical protein
MWLPQKHDDVEPEPPRFENPERVMMITDSMGRRIPPKRPPEKIFAVLNLKTPLSGTDCGSVISTHKTFAAANKASATIPHSRVLELKPSRDWKAGDHISGVHDVRWDNRKWS